MEDSVKERLKSFLKNNKIKGGDFCESIGVSSGFISAMRESIQPDKLKSIAINYPTLSIEWLMIGMGDMLKSEKNNLEIESLKLENALLKKEIEYKDQMIDRLLTKLTPVAEGNVKQHSERSA